MGGSSAASGSGVLRWRRPCVGGRRRRGGVGGACDFGGAAAVGDLEIWDGDVYAEQNGGGWGREGVKQGCAWSRASLASEAAGVGEVAAVGDFGSRGRGAGRRKLGIGGSRVILFF
jgi:hypothetical protein